MAKENIIEDIEQLIRDEDIDPDTGIAEPVELLVSAVKANKVLLKQASAEIRQSRESIRNRTAWKDFLKKYLKY